MVAEADSPVAAHAAHDADPLVEAVPNFSEGRDDRVIRAIAEALDGGGAQVLHVDSNPDANRTVVTLAGPLGAVTEALHRGMAVAVASIDMSRQSGAHIRVGAADVVPVVCLESGEEAVQRCLVAVAALAEWVAQDLEVPVFLYEQSALRPPFRSLPRCRRGGYEALAARFEQGDRDGGASEGPDLGPREFSESVARTGASVLGVRRLLVALNFTLDSSDEGLAREIAAAVRSSGPGDPSHRLPHLRAVGWTMPGYGGRVQVSTNLLDFQRTSAHQVLGRISQLSPVEVVGAELIGLAPAQVFIDAALDASGGGAPAPPPAQVLNFDAAGKEALLDEGIACLGLGHLERGAEDFKNRVLERRLLAARLGPSVR